MKRKLLIIASLLMLVLSGCHCNCEEVQTKKELLHARKRKRVQLQRT